MMTNREVAMEYLRCFCAGDIDGLEPLLAADLSFNGTFHEYRSREAYVGSLRLAPPEECRFEVLSVTESGDSVAVFYNYRKPDRIMTIAQWFKIQSGQIEDVLLVFDGRGF